jgi:hypothetical protein
VRTDDLALAAILAPQGPHRVPARLTSVIDALGGA